MIVKMPKIMSKKENKLTDYIFHENLVFPLTHHYSNTNQYFDYMYLLSPTIRFGNMF